MGDRLAVLNCGVLQQLDTPQQIYDRPANLFVARFIGSPAMNVLPMRLTAVDGEVEVVAAEVRLRLPAAQAQAARAFDQADVLVGIRPEHLELDLLPEAPEGTAIAGRVNLVERLGNEVLVYVDALGDTLIARLPADAPVEHGRSVRLRVQNDRLYLFDSWSERAIACEG